MTDINHAMAAATDTGSGGVNRRTFVTGLSTAALATAAAAALPAGAAAALELTPSAGPAGLIGIAGRITDSLGNPEKRAYVEIHHHRVRDWRPGVNGSNIHVDTWEAPDWFGVWTDDDGVFGLHTWWSVDDVTESDLTKTPARAQVLFHIETTGGARLLRTMWLEPNPHHAGYDPQDPATLTPVAWSKRQQAAQYVVDFAVG